LCQCGVYLRRSFLEIRAGGECRPRARENLRVDALFFDGPDSGHLEASDGAALNKLRAAGIEAQDVPLYLVVDRIMLQACRHGLVTNALGTSRRWGPKHQQELNLRRYERATDCTVIRPATYIARPHELAQVLSSFAARSQPCLIKPVFGEGGRDLHIVHPGDAFPVLDYSVVVQQLMPDPLLIEGHKADLRWYLLIDVNSRDASKRLRPIFLRRASTPYIPEHEDAEITNTAYRTRLGLPPDMRPLAPMADISLSLYAEIISQLDSMANSLLNAFFWNLECAGEDAIIPNRLIVFGVDTLVTLRPKSDPRLYFLETNPFPAFFRGLADCDLAVEEMLSTEYLPALIANVYKIENNLKNASS
jgi:hypothetical protein